MFCTELDPSMRCNGCPLNSLPRELKPHEALAMGTSVSMLLGNQEEDITRESYVKDVLEMQDRMESAVGHLRWKAGEIATWRTIGACEQHDGPILYDPEEEKRMNSKLNAYLVQDNIRGEE